MRSLVCLILTATLSGSALSQDRQLRVDAQDCILRAADYRCNLGKRINTIMQTCFFAISGILPREQALQAIKDAVRKTYGRKGRRIIEHPPRDRRRSSRSKSRYGHRTT